MPVKVHVVYWLLNEEARKFVTEHLNVRALLKDLLSHFEPNDLDFTHESTPNISGYFEVSVGGTLVHSKKNGQGYVHTEAKLNKIVAAIEALM